MTMYIREDGVMCEAEQFLGREAMTEEGVRQQLFMLQIHGVNHAQWEPERHTDEWFENEDGEPEEIVEPERIELFHVTHDLVDDKIDKAKSDTCALGDYFVKRDGAVYVMQKEMFESIWTEISMKGIG